MPNLGGECPTENASSSSSVDRPRTNTTEANIPNKLYSITVTVHGGLSALCVLSHFTPTQQTFIAYVSPDSDTCQKLLPVSFILQQCQKLPILSFVTCRENFCLLFPFDSYSCARPVQIAIVLLNSPDPPTVTNRFATPFFHLKREQCHVDWRDCFRPVLCPPAMQMICCITTTSVTRISW